jgi:hypothetical protein
VNGNQAFQFIDQNQFTAAGQLRWYQRNGDTVIEANTADLTAGVEMKIVLDPLALAIRQAVTSHGALRRVLG